MPTGVYPRIPQRERLLAKLVVDLDAPRIIDDAPCWLFTGTTATNGYGNIAKTGRRGNMEYAHRVAYSLLYGPIPDGLTIDHLCRNRSCCNPAHMEPVTSRENTLRGEAPTAKNARKTHCPQDHPYDEANTKIKRGRRCCRECEREYHRARRKAAA